MTCALSHQRRDAAHDRRRSETPGRGDRLPLCPAHVGTEFAVPPPRPLRDTRRRHTTILSAARTQGTAAARTDADVTDLLPFNYNYARQQQVVTANSG